jgi:hypothetical protein
MSIRLRKPHTIIILSLLVALLTGATLGYCDFFAPSHCSEDCLCFCCQAFTANDSAANGHLLFTPTVMRTITLEPPVSLCPSDIFHPPNLS